jgi:type IV secretory pathway component VirB8
LRWGLFLAGGIIAVTAIGLGAMASLGAEPTYYVRVRSSSGEANVMQSKNKAQVARIVKAIDKAILSRVELTSFHSADAQST